MKNRKLLIATCAAAMLCGIQAKAQDETVVTIDEFSVAEVPCATHYYSTAGDNWFIQLGAGMNMPIFYDSAPGEAHSNHITAGYNFGFGKWITPQVGLRVNFLGGAMHWTSGKYQSAKYVNGNFDVMWDMFNSFGSVNSGRVFSIVPFVGVGGTFAWDFHPNEANIVNKHGDAKANSWTLPASAGLQLRLRMCKYADFFVEGRAQFYGDNFNNEAYGRPVDIDITAMAGFSFNIGGAGYKSYNPCDYLGYISNLNNQVNDLRGALATTTAALAVAEAQLPCPEATVVENVVVEQNTLMSTVRFGLNSAVITPQEEVNVYNVAAWMNDNPEAAVTIVGYADRKTGTADYNMKLSMRRAQAVSDMLVNKYGINPDRLSIQAEGSNSQPYEQNNWNRIVIFSAD